MPHSALRTSRVAAIAVALAATLAVASPTSSAVTPSATAGPAGSPSAASAPRLKVLTYNTFLMSKNLYPNWGQDHRAQAIASADFFHDNDVVVLQEAFDNSSSDALKSQAAAEYPHQTPVVGRSRSGWDATGGAYSAVTPEDGGVTLLSKWPVLREEQYIYKDACGSDSFSNKGFVYAVLDVNGTKVHVVGTHTQSTDSGCQAGEAAADRAKQLKEMDAFLDAKNIPADEEIMVAGDMNIDSHGSEYDALLANADLVPADSRTGHPYSFDTQENSIAAYRYPNDPREDLDYVLFRNGHARPTGWRNTVIKEQSAPWTVSSWGKDYTYTNLSDHYPVVGG
ncbi:sphingomyelin phosphodiesterase [Streptomyces noursei]|uniref:sphingomyelin phosphodiesterase n=1 Tax=Streptomyces noursei TaxID=1971 RepID=UPI001675CC1B|nr:sphingomyelin phosphodiesterase [Streptomyces noursei]MCZ1019201.1 sphingomyelin phosphodiesterase [Streptomyces noursei]GGX29617.1 sphingomyelin phosphodiesterase [Streptomyces noursei]